MASKRYLKAVLALLEQREWMLSHGGDLPGYILKYGSVKDADHYGDGGEAIFEADAQELLKRLAEVERLRKYQRKTELVTS